MSSLSPHKVTRRLAHSSWSSDQPPSLSAACEKRKNEEGRQIAIFLESNRWHYDLHVPTVTSRKDPGSLSGIMRDIVVLKWLFVMCVIRWCGDQWWALNWMFLPKISQRQCDETPLQSRAGCCTIEWTCPMKCHNGILLTSRHGYSFQTLPVSTLRWMTTVKICNLFHSEIKCWSRITIDKTKSQKYFWKKYSEKV